MTSRSRSFSINASNIDWLPNWRRGGGRYKTFTRFRFFLQRNFPTVFTATRRWPLYVVNGGRIPRRSLLGKYGRDVASKKSNYFTLFHARRTVRAAHETTRLLDPFDVTVTQVQTRRRFGRRVRRIVSPFWSDVNRKAVRRARSIRFSDPDPWRDDTSGDRTRPNGPTTTITRSNWGGGNKIFEKSKGEFRDESFRNVGISQLG